MSAAPNAHLDAALRLAALGWPVLPMHSPSLSGDTVLCSCSSSACDSVGKHPHTGHGYKDATTDPVRITRWWTDRPHANVAVATGAGCGKGGVVVLDVDAGSGGRETLARLESIHGVLPTTVRAHSGGGGEHLYFRLPRVHLGNWVGALPGLDLRTTGSCIIVPPSVHRSGDTYRWAEGCAPWERELAEAPAWLTNELINARAARKQLGTGLAPGGTVGPRQVSKTTSQFVSHGASEGERNARLFAAACDYRGCNISKEQAMADLGGAAQRCGLEEREISNTIDSAYSKPRDPSRQATDCWSPIPLVRRASSAEPGCEGERSSQLNISREFGADKHHVLIAIRDGKELMYSDQVKITVARSRSKFLTAVRDRHPEVDEEALEAALLQFAETHHEFVRRVKERPELPQGREELLARYDEEVAKELSTTPQATISEADRMLADPNMIDVILADIHALGVVGDIELALTTYLMATSRLLDTPLAAIVQGVTCSGKSYVPDRVSRLFPPEAVFVATDVTQNALYYIPPGRLMHRFIRAGERSRNDNDENAEGTRALREMISAGELNKLVPVKPIGGGPMVTQLLYQPGPIAYIESTTKTQIFDEDANRCLLLGTDESQAQTAAIVAAQAARAVNGKAALNSTVIAKHHAAQRLLKRCNVRIPYAEALARQIPTQRQDARRAMPQILTMISAVALLHQRQRTNDFGAHGFTIEATEHDYVIARRLLAKPMSRSLGGGLPEAVIRFWRRLHERWNDSEFSSNQALNGDSYLHSKGRVNEYLKALTDTGAAECVEESRGNKPARWRLLGDEPVSSAEWLPTIQQLRDERGEQ